MMFYSPKQLGFFHPEIHADRIPADAVEISDTEHRALIEAQATEGKQIIPGPDGRPIAVDRPEPVLPWELARRRAYGSLGDMLDMLYRDLKAHGIEGEFTAHVEAVKAAHPKPG